MFGKKKKTQELIQRAQVAATNYTTWEQDFGFLTLLLTREINANKLFVLMPMSKQLDKTSSIRDEDIVDSVSSVIGNILNTLSENYVNFLINKYFKNYDALVNFIADSVYLEVFKNANEENQNKINVIKSKSLSKAIGDLNRRKIDIPNK